MQADRRLISSEITLQLREEFSGFRQQCGPPRYYYYFDHYYSSRLLEALPAADQRKYADQIASGVLPHQEPDGSLWDFAMWDYWPIITSSMGRRLG